jgi:hypothetical protein
LFAAYVHPSFFFFSFSSQFRIVVLICRLFFSLKFAHSQDFFQIPPVVKEDDNARTKKRLAMIEERKQEPMFMNNGYCFEARTWSLCFPPASHFELTEVRDVSLRLVFVSFFFPLDLMLRYILLCYFPCYRSRWNTLMC